uniref:Uncharacterized protein LOC114349489 n=1 Tax=Diabrotica virgifera virgifera TaxID=50390 RepID=A0A6P7HDI5_DIAVI
MIQLGLSPVPEKDDAWRIRRNNEVNELNVVTFIILYDICISQRLSCLGYVQRQVDAKTTKKILQRSRLKGAKKERPRTRWMDDVKDDLQTMNIRQWRRKAQERSEEKDIAR